MADGSRRWDAIRAAGATMFVGNPLLFAEILTECRSRGGLPSKLRFLLTGGGPLPPTLRKAWRDEFAMPLVERFGQSEIGGFFALGYPQVEPDDTKLLRVGPPTPDKEVRIVGSTGEPVAVGVPGEIVLRGGFMWGYWGKPDKTAEVLRDGWLHSGDIGVFDAQGFLTMRGRRNELLHVAGKDGSARCRGALCRQRGVNLAAVDFRMQAWHAGRLATHPGAWRGSPQAGHRRGTDVRRSGFIPRRTANADRKNLRPSCGARREPARRRDRPSGHRIAQKSRGGGLTARPPRPT